MFKKFKRFWKNFTVRRTHSKCKEEHYEVGISVLATLFNTEDDLRVYFSGLTFSH